MDIDQMLYTEAIELAKDANLRVPEFLSIAKLEELRQEDWNTFWKEIHTMKNEKMHIFLNGKEMYVTNEELKEIVYMLGDGEKENNILTFNA